MSQEKSECLYTACKRKPLESSERGHRIFHAKPEEKGLREFHEAPRNYMDKIKVRDLDYDFGGFIFVGYINFGEHYGVSVFKNANFFDATFQQDSHFGWAEFQGDTSFLWAKFQRSANFFKATFQGQASFWEAKFERGANFG